MRGSWLTSVHHVLVYLFLDGQLIVCLFYTLFDGLVDLGVRYLAFLSPQLFRSLKLNVTNTEQDKKWPTPNRHSANGRNFVEERYIPSLACESISWIKDTYIFFKTDIIFCEINSFPLYVPIVCSAARLSEKASQKVAYWHRMRVIEKPCFSKKTLSSAPKHDNVLFSSQGRH